MTTITSLVSSVRDVMTEKEDWNKNPSNAMPDSVTETLLLLLLEVENGYTEMISKTFLENELMELLTDSIENSELKKEARVRPPVVT